MAIAMVVTSINYTPKAVEAAEDYSGLSFTKVTVTMDATYEYYIDSSKNSIGASPIFENTTNMKLVYSANNTPENTTITVNGETKTTTDDVVYECAKGMTTFNLSALEDNAYHELVVTSDLGSVTVIIKKGNPEGDEDTTSETATSSSIYGGLGYTAITNNTFDAVADALKNSEYAVVGMTLGTIQFEGDCTYIYINNVNIGGSIAEGEGDGGGYKSISVNGNTSTTTVTGATFKINNAASVLTYEYNVVQITTSAGVGKLIIYCPGNAGKGTYEEQTTTEAATEVETDPDDETVTLKALEDAYVYNFTEAGEGFKLGFEDPNEDTVTALTGTYTYTLNIGEQKIEGIAYNEDGDYTVDLSGLNLTSGSTYSVTVNAVYTDGETTVTSPASATTEFTYNTTATVAEDRGITQIFFTTSSNSAEGKDVNDLYTGDENNKEKVPTAITVKDTKGKVIYDYGTANVRGNSTANAAKKPYNFKFSSKQNVCGMGKAKKWSLLANLFDKTLMRNQIAMDFQRELEATQEKFADEVEKTFTSECEPAELYIDGNYVGTYTLIESVQVAGTRVDIDIDYEDEDTDEIKADAQPTSREIDGTTYEIYDVLLELANDSRLDSEAYYFLGSLDGGPNDGKQQWAINEPERNNEAYGYVPADTNKPKFVNLTQTYIQAFENALSENNYDIIDQFIDVDSFVDFYITAELFMTKDIAFSSTRFYIRDGVIYAGPLWDLDLSSGNNGANPSAENLYAQGFNWFKLLMANETFAAKVKARYAELQGKIKNLYATGGAVDTAYNTIAASAKANYEDAYTTPYATKGTIGDGTGWGYTYVYGNGGYFDQAELKLTLDQAYNGYGVYGTVDVYDNYEDYITEYKAWLKARNAWLLEEWDIDITEGVYVNAENDVVVGWNADASATGSGKYIITYTPATLASTTSLLEVLQASSPIMTLDADSETATIEVEDTSAEAYTYNFTDNGINLKDNSAVTVTYTSDEETYTEVLSDEAASDLSILNRVTVDGLKAVITTNVTNNGTAAAESVVLTLKSSDDTVVDTQTISAIAAGGTGTAVFERTETAGDYTYTISTGLLSSGVVYSCADEDTLSCTATNDYLTAAISGATYLQVGSITGQEGSFGFTTDGYNINVGATDRAIYVRLNGEVVASNEGTSALGINVAYSKLKKGIVNEIQIEFVDALEDGITYTTYIQTVYIAVPYAEEQSPDLTTVVANTPDVTGTDGWMQPSGENNFGASTNSDETYNYYIATSYYSGGENNTFLNGNFYAYYADATTIRYGGESANTVKGEASAFSSNIIRNGIESVWISYETEDKIISEKLTEGTEYYHSATNSDVLTITAEKFTLGDNETEKVYYVTVRVEGTDYSWPIKVEKVIKQTETVPEGAEWKIIPNSTEYYYYISEKYTSDFNAAGTTDQGEKLYFSFYGNVQGPLKSATLGETGLTIDNTGLYIPKTLITEEGKVYKLYLVGANDYAVTVFVKYQKVPDYKPTGLTATTAGTGTDALATIYWTASEDAISAGETITYTVTVNGESATVTGTTATFELDNLEYGEYEVILKTFNDGVEVDSQTTTVKYKDPEAVDSELTVIEQWEARRWEVLSWTEVENATGYAIYVDGELFTTTTDITYNLPAYAFANQENANGQPTTVGKHNVKVVALFEDETAPDTYAETDSKHLIGSDDATLYVNYVYGSETDLWNKQDVDSPWNFTICESSEEGAVHITEGADVIVKYDTDGSALLTINNTGTATEDQAWTIKAALYDNESTVGESIKLAFDIKGPASLIGQELKIKCTPEEVQADGQYAGATYKEAVYPFKDDGNGGAVLHYSESFTATNSTYDLFFGLGLLTLEGESLDLVLTDTSVIKVYGLKDVTPSAVPNKKDSTNNGILVNWTSDVPSHLESKYTYKVFIDGEEVEIPEGEEKIKSGLTYYGYAEGEHTVVVKSYYDGTETSSIESTVTIEDTALADVVITDISIPDKEDGDFWRIGDSVPVTVTMKNIGTVDAVADGNLTMTLYAVNGETQRFIEYQTLETQGNILEAGDSVTKTFTYTISNEDDKGGYLFDLMARADTDGKVEEGTAGEANNDYTETFKFYAKLEEVTLTNDGTNISASWPAHDDTNAKYIIKYTDAINGDEVQIETTGNTPYITFPEGTLIANNSEVDVISVHTDGSSHIYATGIALADLIITDVEVPDYTFVGEDLSVTVKYKNIGVAVAEPRTDTMFVVMVTDGNTSPYKDVTSFLNPNETDEVVITGSWITEAGTATLKAIVDEANRIDESDETDASNIEEFDVYAVSETAVELTYVEGVGVRSTWDTVDGATEYIFRYTTDGVEHEDRIPYDASYLVTTEDGKCYCTVGSPIDENTIFEVYAVKDGSEILVGAEKAKVDLKITNVGNIVVDNNDATDNEVRIGYSFSADVTVKNVGTAQRMAAPADATTTEETYGYTIPVAVTWNGEDGNAIWKINDGYYNGLAVDREITLTISGIEPEVEGETDFVFWVDHYEYTAEDGSTGKVEFCDESVEDNNTWTENINVAKRKQIGEMDWTRLTNEAGTEDYLFDVGSGFYKDLYIEYKVLDTSYTDVDYKDLFSGYYGYDPMWLQMNIRSDGEHDIVSVTDGKSQTTVDFSQVSADFCNNYSADRDSEANFETLATRGCDIVDADGNVIIPIASGDSSINYNGNGFQFFTNSMAPGKYYAFKIKSNTDDNYITVALRVTDENGSWIQARANDASDINALPFWYHSAYGTGASTTGSLYYDGSDLGLSVLGIYNGNHLVVTTDTAKPLNLDDEWYIEMGYATTDENGNFVILDEGDTFEVDGEEIEVNYVRLDITDGIGRDGTNSLQIKLPELIEKIPVHSSQGGVRDNEYYFMKVYYDPVEHPGEYVPIPIRIEAYIPQIESVNGLTVAGRGENLSVSWTNTATQDAHGYLYDVYIDGELVATDVVAGVYNFEGYDVQTLGVQHNVRVVAKWCEQTTDAAVTYIAEKANENVETLPGENIVYPEDPEKWVLIDGEYILPVLDHNTVSRTVNAKIYYYTDDDINSVVGYNEYYISLNGSTEYFTGNSSKIYVQDGNSTTFVSKTIYDNFYPGQILMNASQMFSTYGDWETGDELYYTVKVVGDNGNTSKNFYFKIIPTDEEYTETDTGEWREISGQSKLPVKIGDTSLEGTVYFYDYPSKTNTYDIVGYNGYYMSIIGKGNYYTGTSTTMEISKAMEDTSIETNTSDILANVDSVDYEFAEKGIVDKAYSGQIIIRSEDTFEVAYGTTYYILKVNGKDSEGNDTVTYVPIKIVVETGSVEVQGFQMNTNTSVGAVAEYNASFRVVSKASKVMSIHNKLYVVKGTGTVYGLESDVSGDYDQMIIDGGKGVYNYRTTSMGTYQGYTSGNGDEKYYNYFALTFKCEGYSYGILSAKYAFRAYAVLDDGTEEGKVVYGENVYSASMYEIAENLYDNSKMPTIESHNYLYDNVLNIVTIGNNRNGIAAAMNKALGVTSTSMPDYQLVNAAYKDMYNYIHCYEGYTYLTRGEFKCSDASVEKELLGKLNTAAGTNCETLSDWIYENTSSYKNSKGVYYKGFYEKVPYDWENNIFKDFDSE